VALKAYTVDGGVVFDKPVNQLDKLALFYPFVLDVIFVKVEFYVLSAVGIGVFSRQAEGRQDIFIYVNVFKSRINHNCGVF